MFLGKYTRKWEVKGGILKRVIFLWESDKESTKKQSYAWNKKVKQSSWHHSAISSVATLIGYATWIKSKD